MDIVIAGGVGLLLVAGCLFWAALLDRRDHRAGWIAHPTLVTTGAGLIVPANGSASALTGGEAREAACEQNQNMDAPTSLNVVPPVVFDQPDLFENDRTTFFDGSSQMIQLDEETLKQLSAE